MFCVIVEPCCPLPRYALPSFSPFPLVSITTLSFLKDTSFPSSSTSSCPAFCHSTDSFSVYCPILCLRNVRCCSPPNIHATACPILTLSACSSFSHSASLGGLCIGPSCLLSCASLFLLHSSSALATRQGWSVSDFCFYFCPPVCLFFFSLSFFSHSGVLLPAHPHLTLVTHQN